MERAENVQASQTLTDYLVDVSFTETFLNCLFEGLMVFPVVIFFESDPVLMK